MASVGAGEKLSPAGMAALLGTERLSAERAEAIFALFASRREPVTNKLSLRGLIGYLTDGFAADAAFAPFLGEEKIALLARGAEKLDEAEAMLCKEEVCRAVIRTTYPTEGEETYAFVARVNDLLAPLAGRVYFAGDSCYAYEMNAGFNREFSLITLLTMAAIVLIVFLTFRSAVIPPILVAVIQCAVFATMAIMRLSGMTVFFLAILVLQSILMGATIDYAILFTSHYREFRRENDRAAALKLAYRASVGTVLTSATILTAGTLLVGRFAIEIVSKICLAIGYGTVCATLLILIFTPAMIAALDRFVVPKNKNEKEKKA